AAQPAAMREPVVDEDDVCELFYTSGTTGDPKGVMLTHRNLHTHALDSALTMGVHHRDVVLHTIPLFHVNGWGTPHWVTALGARPRGAAARRAADAAGHDRSSQPRRRPARARRRRPRGAPRRRDGGRDLRAVEPRDDRLLGAPGRDR